MLLARSATFAIAMVAITVSACVHPAIGSRPGLDLDPPRPPTGASRSPSREQPEIAPKRVARKDPVATLVAHDGTWCSVTEDRFRKTEVGDNVWCAWTSG